MLWFIGKFLAMQTFFLCKTISNKIFHFDYKYIINKLPKSLVKRACQKLLHYSKDPILLKFISKKSEWIESYLRHILEIYSNSLNQKHKTMI